jgi:hypothetical protein
MINSTARRSRVECFHVAAGISWDKTEWNDKLQQRLRRNKLKFRSKQDFYQKLPYLEILKSSCVSEKQQSVTEF